LLLTKYYPDYKAKKMRLSGYVESMGEGSCTHCCGNLQRRHKLDLKVMGREGVEFSDLAQDTVKWRTGVKEVMKM
jgi:hypothetical protein